MITVALDRFDGPLDVLLALVRRNQYPLDELPIAEITRQYLAYIKEASGADVELGADFLETASWLVLLKSRAMLPQAAGDEAPSLELERALFDHETLIRMAGLLRSRIDGGRGTEALEPGRGVSTEGWFAELPVPEAKVTLLMALLEMARLQRVLLGQRREFGPVLLKRLACGAVRLARSES